MNPGSSPDSPISHGICDSCFRSHLSRLGIDIGKDLDFLDAPVILVNPDARVLDINGNALQFIDKPLSRIVNSLTGDVLGCKYTTLPGGCGKTDSCTLCVIRNTVRKTYETGEPVERCLVEFMKENSGTAEPTYFLISARKAGPATNPAILVRIDPVVDGIGINE